MLQRRACEEMNMSPTKYLESLLTEEERLARKRDIYFDYNLRNRNSFSNPYFYTQKIKFYKDEIVLTQYPLPLLRNYSSSQTSSNSSEKTIVSRVEKTQNKVPMVRLHRNLVRCRQNLLDIVRMNTSKNTKFITLTYNQNMTDLEQSSIDINRFFKRLRRRIGSFSYVYCREFQARGAIHFHIILFFSSFVPQKVLSECWEHGFFKINRVDSVKNVARYAAKYIIKAFESCNTDEFVAKYPNFRLYSCSLGLERPKFVYLRPQYAIDMDNFVAYAFKEDKYDLKMPIYGEKYGDCPLTVFSWHFSISPHIPISSRA